MTVEQSIKNKTNCVVLASVRTVIGFHNCLPFSRLKNTGFEHFGRDTGGTTVKSVWKGKQKGESRTICHALSISRIATMFEKIRLRDFVIFGECDVIVGRPRMGNIFLPLFFLAHKKHWRNGEIIRTRRLSFTLKFYGQLTLHEISFISIPLCGVTEFFFFLASHKLAVGSERLSFEVSRGNPPINLKLINR